MADRYEESVRIFVTRAVHQERVNADGKMLFRRAAHEGPVDGVRTWTRSDGVHRITHAVEFSKTVAPLRKGLFPGSRPATVVARRQDRPV
jgi:hypothetical protein